MIKFIKKLFCKHSYELNRWYICHGPNGDCPAMIEAEYICTKCGKVTYADDNIEAYEVYLSICKPNERRFERRNK